MFITHIASCMAGEGVRILNCFSCYLRMCLSESHQIGFMLSVFMRSNMYLLCVHAYISQCVCASIFHSDGLLSRSLPRCQYVLLQHWCSLPAACILFAFQIQYSTLSIGKGTIHKKTLNDDNDDGGDVCTLSERE